MQPATILGSVAADLAHLMAELIENALVFSQVDRSVEVRGHARPEGVYRLTVVDHGVGMMPDAIEASNRRLGGSESFTVAPSKYLGHYVAGNLAARHGIAVRLAPTAGGGGVTATVDVPASLLTPQDQLAAAGLPWASAAVPTVTLGPTSGPHPNAGSSASHVGHAAPIWATACAAMKWPSVE